MDKSERPLSLSVVVTKHIRRMIITGELPLGASISERGISEVLSVSKSPVREALSQLKNEGLVTIVPQSGAKVFLLNEREVEEISTFRLVTELSALELAMEHDPHSLLKSLSDIEYDMSDCWNAATPRQYLDLEIAFHLAFFKHCGNSFLLAAYSQFSGKIAALHTHFIINQHQARATFDEYSEILAAVQKKDTVSARRLLSAHISKKR